MKHDDRLRRFEHSFRAMGTEVALWVWNNNEQRAKSALFGVERFFAQTESRLSRFRPDSELSRLNRAAGWPFAASQVLFDLVASALYWRQQTNGIFDPGVLNALLAHGYDRTFAAVLAEQAVSSENVAPAAVSGQSQLAISVPSSDGIQLGPQHTICLPAGLQLDLGGIAKGWAIQQAAHRLGMWGPCMVDAGGDIATVGAQPGEPWMASVADPTEEGQDLAFIALQNEAIATSSRVYRTWEHARPSSD
jgi:thiamine biosynthesis lipoprotein